MPTLLEVSIKGLPTHVQEIRTDFTLVLDTETVQLVQPVRNGLAVPSKRKLERVVDPLFGFFRCLVGSEIGRDFVDELFQLQLSFPGGQSGSSLDVLLGIADKRRNRREEELWLLDEDAVLLEFAVGAGAEVGASPACPPASSLSAALICFFEVK
jgi:hypothetical protein